MARALEKQKDEEDEEDEEDEDKDGIPDSAEVENENGIPDSEENVEVAAEAAPGNSEGGPAPATVTLDRDRTFVVPSATTA